MRDPLTRWYFAHPSERRDGGRRIAAYIQRMAGVELLNPFDGVAATPGNVISRDLTLINRCHGLLAWLPPKTQTVGTYMEIFYAGRVADLPVLIYTYPGLSQHPWLIELGQVHFNISRILELLRGARDPHGPAN